MFEVNIVAMASMLQVLKIFDLLYCIVDRKTNHGMISCLAPSSFMKKRDVENSESDVGS